MCVSGYDVQLICLSRTQYRFPRFPQVPGPYPGINANTRNNVRLNRVPIDISNGAVMRMQDVLDGCLSRHHKIPDEA